MYFHKRLFVSEKIENKEEILALLEEGIPVFNLYMICVCKNSKNMFDIILSSEYFKEINKDKKYIIVGLAMGKKDSFSLLEDIFKWWLERKKNPDGIKNYFCKLN